jgi:hypothetical protein
MRLWDTVYNQAHKSIPKLTCTAFALIIKISFPYPIALHSKFFFTFKLMAMTFHLLNAVKDYLSPKLIDSISNHLSENSSDISIAVSVSIPVTLAGIIKKAENGGTAALLSAGRQSASCGVLNDLGLLFDGRDSFLLTTGASFLIYLFGSRMGSVVRDIANFAGIRNDSACSLSSMLALLCFGVIGKHAKENNLSESSLHNFLLGEKSFVAKALPSGLASSNLFDSNGMEIAFLKPGQSTLQNNPTGICEGIKIMDK